MGVLGLTPFLQKTCPEVIKQIPERFRGLAGKKVVIDGTLITQRFHFVPAPHRYRHVLGWYRLMKELHEAGVSAVCVFDGKERNIAKTREAERRREQQRKTVARGLLEQERSQRLRQLFNTLRQFRNFDSETRAHAIQLLGESSATATQDLSNLSVTNLAGATLRESSPALKSPRTPYYEDRSFEQDSIEDKMLESTLEDGRLGLFSAAHDAQYYSIDWDFSLLEHPSHDLSLPPTSHLIEPVYQAIDADPDILTHVSPACIIEQGPGTLLELDSSTHPNSRPLPTSTTSDDASLLKTLLTLYANYRQSVLKLSSLATPLVTSASTIPSVRDPITQAEIALTKEQYRVMLEEGGFWSKIFAAGEAVSKAALDETLEKLSRASEMMSASFERRMNPPTDQTYQECREIIQAMGVPCIDSVGAVEAEALASSIVLNGLADYVASEDTDVVVYEAPLLRNLTTRNVPLTIVSGAEIRTVLQLNRTSFIDFALLLGTDFSQRIKNVGPARALKFIREHGTIERVIEVETKYLPRISNKAYLAQVEAARQVFLTLPPVPEAKVLEQDTIDEAEVIEVLQKYGLGRAVANDEEWDLSSMLEGNYFNDNPSAT